MAYIIFEHLTGPRKPRGPKPMQVVADRLTDISKKFENFIEASKKEQNRELELESIANGIRNSKTQKELILYFCLAVDRARNSTAHAYGAKHDRLNADWAGPIFDALVLFVPWALTQLQAEEQTD